MRSEALRPEADARLAEQRSGIAIRELDDMRSLAAVQRLYEAVWRTGPAGTPVTADLLRALAKSGNPVFGAFDGDELLGACFGFCSPPDTANFHSHIAGVTASAQGRSIGLALKLRQRSWALGRGMRSMTWTFDPLIRRNAVFNLAKLGAEPFEYLTDFYGQMDDDVNRGDASDRLLVRWHLDRPLPPHRERVVPLPPGAIRIPVPADVEALRLDDPLRAAEWRLDLRRELGARMAAGAAVIGFARDGHYLVVPATAQTPAEKQETPMKLAAIETRVVEMPLVTPFRTSFGTETVRQVLVVRAETDEAEGWGECGASEAPLYSSEYTGGAAAVIRDFFVPALSEAQRDLGDAFDAHRVAPALAPFKEHRLAKSALETAILDAQLRARGVSFASALGAVRESVPCGVSLGITDTIDQLLDTVAASLDAGYVRIKLKIEPGWDLDPVRAVRERFGDIDLQVDANAAYRRSDARLLAKLDAFDLTLIEQPLPADDLLGHAALAREIRTPICLDESITSARAAATAIELGAVRIVNIKPGRVGGYLEARRIHDLCAAHDVPVWCGGMLETGIGRAANVALAALPGFLLPGDTSASERYFATDLTEPFRLEQGRIAVPTGPGLGVTPIPEVLDRFTVRRDRLPC